MRLLKNVLTIAGLTSISRVLGMVREILMSYTMGASWIADVFIVAFRFPNFFRRFFAEGAFNGAFIPQFTKTVEGEGQKSGFQMAQETFSVMAWGLTFFSIVVIIFAPAIVPVLAPGFKTNPERLELAISFTRIMFPYILFISLSALMGGILNAFNQFAVCAAAPIILNIVMITALGTYDMFGLTPAWSLTYAVMIAGFIQFLWMHWAVSKLGLKLTLKAPKLYPRAKKILSLMIPGAIGAGVTQINLLIDMVLASFLPAGSIAFLYYADRLNQLPLSIFGVAMGTALLPQLSKLLQTDPKGASNLQTKALLFALQMTIPACFALIILATPLISLIFGHGSFSNENVMQTGPALAAFAIGLPAHVCQKIYTARFFAQQDVKTPVRIGIVCVVINIVLTLILMKPFLHTGMAMATSISGWVNVILLGWVLNRQNAFSYPKIFFKKLLQSLVLSACLAMILIVFRNILYTAQNPTIWTEIFHMGYMICAGGAFYGVGLLLIERERALRLYRKLCDKIKRPKII